MLSFGKLVRGTNARIQLQQVRFGRRNRGKPPTVARTLQQRLEEINFKDELYTSRTDIGLPFIRVTKKNEMKEIEKVRKSKELEQLSRHQKLFIDSSQVKKDWLSSNGPHQIKKIADHYGIYEHLYGEGYFIPSVPIEVYYHNEDNLASPVYYGNTIKPEKAKDKPEVIFNTNENSLWTLVLTSLDGHFNDDQKEYVHWFVANIPQNNLEKGDVIMDYLQPIPLRGTGYHRYVFVLYKQENKINYDLKTVPSAASLHDRTFVSRDWYKKFQDQITPAGLAFYQTDWDKSVTEFFHRTLNQKEPVFEYDFPAPYIKPQKWFPLRQPFNEYMDKYRDPKQIKKEYLMKRLREEHPFKNPPPPLKFPNAQKSYKYKPSWYNFKEIKDRLGWGRVNETE